MSNLIPSYRGCANEWECDEMAHMNVRYYIKKAEEGLGVIAAFLGMTPDYLRHHGLELFIEDVHVRYLREMRGGADILVEGGVLEAGKDHMRVFQSFCEGGKDHTSAVVTVLVRMRHSDSMHDRPFPGFALTKSEEIACTIPQSVQPRSIPLEGPFPGGDKAAAEALGMRLITLGQINSDEVDAQGRLRPYGYMGRVSDGIGLLMKELRRDTNLQTEENESRLGGAALEYRLRYYKQPQIGDTIAIYAGLAQVTERFVLVNHWAVDYATGEALCSSQAIAVSIDLVARKALARSPEQVAAMLPLVVQGFDAHLLG
ncbi:MAG: acyl-ACP thioesterase [Alphaproteobacteria bacterium]|nr:MAG: acyl-ACP thioesterase [Alphaproteobacteria bacterium]